MPGVREVIIGLDTSAPVLAAAVQVDGKIYSCRRKGIKQERLLFPALKGLLNKASCKLPEVSKIFIVRGPGRFTGIRIALTFASMLKYLSGTKVYGATVFEVIREQVLASKRFKQWKTQNPSGVLAVVLHAFREEYFLQFFGETAQAPLWLSREQLLQEISACPEPVFVAGTDKDRTALDELTQNRWPLADLKDGIVRADTLIRLVDCPAFEKDALEPLYLKPARFELLGK